MMPIIPSEVTPWYVSYISKKRKRKLKKKNEPHGDSDGYIICHMASELPF